MTGPRRAASLLLAAGLLAAGCGVAQRQAAATAGHPGLPSLATSMVTAGGTWAIAVMGGSAARHDNFWQLFVRPAGDGSWRLVTPPGVASNGGLVAAPAGGRSLVTAFRPSLGLVFSPLATTRDDGTSWSAGVLDAALADVPDALAADPASGRLLALLGDGTAELSARGGTAWTSLATRRTLAASAAGARCGLGELTAAAFSSSGVPMVAGTCAHPGTAGVFAYSGGAWHSAGPAVPASLARQPVAVLRLTRTTDGIAALLAAGTGPTASLVAALSAGGASRWVVSPPLRPDGATVTSASFGPGGTAAVVLTGSRGEIIAGAASRWQVLPALPAGTATLAPGPGGRVEALAVHGTRLTVWQLARGGAAWETAQAISVPIQFGSSG